MLFLEIVELILNVHEAIGIDDLRIWGLLTSYGVTVSYFHVCDVVAMLHDHPPSIEGGLTYNIDWAMEGFRIIVENFSTLETNECISDQLKRKGLNYDWNIGLIDRFIDAYDFWLESDNCLIAYSPACLI